MPYDERALEVLIETSEDMQSDAMAASRAALPDLADAAHERPEVDPEETKRFVQRRRFLRNSLIGAGGIAAAGAFGTALLGALELPAFAQSSQDVMILQTAASIENLAVAAYTKALTLPYIGGSSANKVVTAFVTTTKKQHVQHGAAFNAQIATLGGMKQTNPDPHYLPAVNATVASLAGKTTTQALEAVVGLAITLEEVAAQTYVNDVTMLSDAQSRKVMASIMGVEAQHVAVLLAVQALVKGGAPQLIALPPSPLSALPAAAGSVGFPDVFFPTTMASPASEGAVS